MNSLACIRRAVDVVPHTLHTDRCVSLLCESVPDLAHSTVCDLQRIRNNVSLFSLQSVHQRLTLLNSTRTPHLEQVCALLQLINVQEFSVHTK